MDPLFYACLKVISNILVLLIVLRFIIPVIVKIISPMELQSKPVTESTDWLNFSIERFMEIVDSPEGLEKLSNAISNAMAPNYFKLNSIGSNPIISHISTLKMKEADDIRIAVPITLDIGPSFDVGFNCKNLILKIDVIKLKTTLLLTWLGNSDTCIELTFVDGFDIDFYLSVKLFHFLTFTLSEIPILGAIIKALGTLFIQRQVIKINLPKPVTRESLQQFY